MYHISFRGVRIDEFEEFQQHIREIVFFYYLLIINYYRTMYHLSVRQVRILMSLRNSSNTSVRKLFDVVVFG